jgi:redox-sensitive bicupin YhaK (pirin superfamily)
LYKTQLISVIDGHLQIGEDATNHEKYHTLVLTSKDGEDGVQLTKPDDTTGETRFVLIAGEPLDQPVVQVCPLWVFEIDF